MKTGSIPPRFSFIVTLFGIRSHYRHLVEVEGLPWNRDTAQHGAAERLVPILMTALVTSLELLPLALTAGTPGNEIEGTMAAVILGDLLTSTILNLLIAGDGRTLVAP